jgi:acyl dehydratase
MAMVQTVFESLDEMRAAVGTTLGTSQWIDVTPAQVDRFAEATGGQRSTGVDDRPASGGHGRVAPPYLILSLTNLVLPQVIEVRGVSLGVNYGTATVRFPAPVPVGSRVRGTAELVACQDVRGGVQSTIVVTMEIEGATQPACVVESLSRWLR